MCTGMCCEHGNGSYKISYDDGPVLKEGGVFYDDEETQFGLCGVSPETEAPTKEPTEAAAAPTISGGGGQPGDAAYRCVATPLVDSGYVVSRDKCDLFVDCFNQYIKASALTSRMGARLPLFSRDQVTLLNFAAYRSAMTFSATRTAAVSRLQHVESMKTNLRGTHHRHCQATKQHHCRHQHLILRQRYRRYIWR